jgi:hypothetical protein
VQSQYRNLHHLSFWEMAISNLGLWEIEESLKCWRNLHKESTVWSMASVLQIQLTYFAVVKSCLCVWCRSPSCAVGWRSEQGRGPKAHDRGPKTAPADRGQVNTARKVRRAESTKMRGTGRATPPSGPRTCVHPPRSLARTTLGNRGTDASTRGGRSCRTQGI